MRQSRFAFIIVCSILYTFRSNMLNPFATEVTVLGSDCPIVNGLSNFTLPELEGLYSAVAFYSQSEPNIDSCYKVRFTPVSDERTDMRVAYKSALSLFPITIDLRLRAVSENGTFQMRDSITGAIVLGQAYILSNDSNIVYYSCRPGLQGLLKSHSREVLVLSKNETPVWTNEDKATVSEMLKAQSLSSANLKPVYQGRETCHSINP